MGNVDRLQTVQGQRRSRYGQQRPGGGEPDPGPDGGWWGRSFQYEIPSNTFSDADSDTLSYATTQADGTTLPTWLTFTPGSGRRIYGTPAATDVGIVSVKVTVSDGKGGSVSDVFDITVEEDTTPPTLTSATVQARPV